MKRMKLKLALLATCGLASLAQAKTYTFTNVDGGSVDEPANWDANGAPGTDPADGSAIVISNFTGTASAGVEKTVVLGDGLTYTWSKLYLGCSTYASGATNIWRLQGGALSLGETFVIRGPGRAKFACEVSSEAPLTAQGAPIQMLGPRTTAVDLVASNGDVILGSDDPADNSTGDVLAPASTLAANGSGSIRVLQSAAAASLAGSDEQANVEIPAGTTLTVGGETSPAETTYQGDLSGSGTLVKKGADYTLRLTERVALDRAFDGTLDVQEGELAIGETRAAPTYDADLKLYLTFDDFDNPGTNLTIRSTAGGTIRYVNFCKSEGEDQVFDHACSRSNGIVRGLRGHAAQTSGNMLGLYDAEGNYNSQAYLPNKDTPRTVVMWIKAEPGSKSDSRLFRWGKASVACQYHARLDGDDGVRYDLNNSTWPSTRFFKGKDLHDGVWHMLAFRYDGVTNLTAALDGVIDSTVLRLGAVPAIASSWTPFLVGGDYDSGGYTGSELTIDEFAVYARELTAEELAELYAARRSAIPTWPEEPETVLPAPLVQWDFDDDDAPCKGEGTNPFDLQPVRVKATPGPQAGSPLGGNCMVFCSDSWNSGAGYLRQKDDALPEGFPSGDASVTVTFWLNAARSNWTRPNNSLFDVFYWGSADANAFILCQQSRYSDGLTGKVGGQASSTLTRLAHENGATAWHHIALGYDKDTKRIFYYADGAKVYDIPNSVANALDLIGGTNFVFGAQPAKQTSNWNFQSFRLDLVRVYEGALTAKQIAADRRSGLRLADDVVQPTATLKTAAGASAVFDADQSFGQLANAGELRLAGGAVLSVTGSGEKTLGGIVRTVGQHDDTGVLEVRDGAALTLSATLDMGVGSKVVVTNATLTVTGAAGTTPIEVLSGGKLLADSALDSDLVIGGGAELDVANPLETSGTAKLLPGFTVRGTDDFTAWTTVLKAAAIDATGVDLTTVVFTNVPSGAKCRLRIKDGCLQAKLATGVILLVR